MFDVQPLKFVVPVVDRFSPVAYAVMIHCHVKITHHGGSINTLRASKEIVHVLNGKSLANEITSSCQYCKRYKAKLLKAEMGKQHISKMTIAPAFFSAQVDIFGPLDAYCKHGKRAVLKVYGLVFKCPTTLAVATYVMDDYSTNSFLDSFYRFAARYGTPAKLFIDGGSQLVSACNNSTLSVADITQSLNNSHHTRVNFEVCPVGGHNMHGMVERQIREIKRIMHAVCHGTKLDIMQWETLFAWISNEINSMPLAIGNRYVDLDHLDLITPSRLLLGRNNTRALVDLVETPDYSGLLGCMEQVEKTWWEVWQKEKLLDLVPQPRKWKSGEPELSQGDLVVFLRDQGALGGPSWRIGMVHEVEVSADNVIRKVVVKYKNAKEKVFRYTTRAVRELAVVWRESELDLPGQLSKAQKDATMLMLISER